MNSNTSLGNYSDYDTHHTDPAPGTPCDFCERKRGKYKAKRRPDGSWNCDVCYNESLEVY